MKFTFLKLQIKMYIYSVSYIKQIYLVTTAKGVMKSLDSVFIMLVRLQKTT